MRTSTRLNRNQSHYHGLLHLTLAALAVVPSQAQLQWAGCPDLAGGELKKTLLVSRSPVGAVSGTTAVDGTLKEPIKLSVARNGDVYIAERGGTIKRWKPDGTVSVIGALDVFTGGKLSHPTQNSNENGLHGIVLDPGFESNNWLYVHYTPKVGNFMNISRWTLAGGALDMNSEKVLLRIPIQRNSCCHTGGGMEFDLEGNLFITVGNNTTNPDTKAPDAYVKESDPDADDQGHAANTNDFRGKILRIKPTADGGYTVPAGNLFPPGTDKTKPEIWAMGVRNPYSLTVDKYRGWVGWGDIGPDDGLSTSEEWNMFTKPGNAGWPYFVGPSSSPSYMWRLNKNPAAPANNSPNNTGLTALPPAIGATIGYPQSCAVTGPVYHYDGANASRKKLPPHLHKKWLVTDWWKGNLEAVTLSEDGATVISRTMLKQQNTFNGPLDLQVGPDGAIYIVEYGQVSGGLWFNSTGNTAISRLEYTGTCHPPTPVPASIHAARKIRIGGMVPGINLGLGRDVALPRGAKGFRLYDVRGHLAWEYAASGSEAGRVRVPAGVGDGILRIKYLD